MPATTNRDLAEGELWELSLERSRRRRVLAASARKEQNRRKTASVAVSAAVAAAPMWPSVAGSGSFEAKADAAKGATQPDGRDRVLLSFGDRSPGVAKLQQELRIVADGIFGPVTEAAVRAFQKRVGLRATGEVDVRTWLALFPNDAIVAAAGSGAGGGGEPQWAAVTAEPTGTTTAPNGATVPAAAPATASAAPGSAAPRRKAKPRPRRGAAAHAASVSTPDVLPGERDPSDSPGGALSPAVPPADAPAHGSPTPGGGGAPRPVAPPAVPPVVPIAPNGSIGEMIQAMIDAANRIDRARYPYRWGGGHNSRFTGPYDCSGAVSAVLHAAGLLRSPLVSGGFMRWGARGPGLVTIYANASHVYMSIKGRFFGTSRSNPGGGAGWFRGAPRPGFVVVHVPFERMKRSMARKRTKRPAPRRVTIRAPRPAPRQAPQGNRVTSGTPAGGYQAPAATTTPTTPPPAPKTVAPAPAPAAPAPAGGSAGQAPPVQSAPRPLTVTTPAGSVTVTPPPAPSGGTGQPPAPAAPAPAAPAPAPTGQVPAPAPTGTAPATPQQAPAPATGTAPGTGTAAGQGGSQEQPAAPAGPAANPVRDAVEDTVAGAGKAVDTVSSTVTVKPQAAVPATPDPGQAAPGSGEGAPGSG